jgi:hypothetical protein
VAQFDLKLGILKEKGKWKTETETESGKRKIYHVRTILASEVIAKQIWALDLYMELEVHEIDVAVYELLK